MSRVHFVSPGMFWHAVLLVQSTRLLAKGREPRRGGFRQVRPLNGICPEKRTRRGRTQITSSVSFGAHPSGATETDRYHPDALLLRRI